MMTLIKAPNGKQRLMVKGSLNTLFYQCTSFLAKNGERQNLNETTRHNLWTKLSEIGGEESIPICVCYKEITADDLDTSSMFNSSEDSSEDQDEFLLR